MSSEATTQRILCGQGKLFFTVPKRDVGCESSETTSPEMGGNNFQITTKLLKLWSWNMAVMPEKEKEVCVCLFQSARIQRGLIDHS